MGGVLLVAGLGLLGWRAVSGDGGAVAQPTGSPSATPSPTPSAAPSPTTVQPVVGGCTKARFAPPVAAPSFSAPADVLTGGAATLTLATNCGDIRIALNTAQAPRNSDSLAFLAKRGFYDNSPCHRLTTKGIFVLQCGDPLGTGAGTAGYTVQDENVPADGSYPRGTVAMAKPAGGRGSNQFFIVYRDTSLPPEYSVVGRVVAGLRRVDAVAKAGVQRGGTDGPPRQAVVVERATVAQGGSNG